MLEIGGVLDFIASMLFIVMHMFPETCVGTSYSLQYYMHMLEEIDKDAIVQAILHNDILVLKCLVMVMK